MPHTVSGPAPDQQQTTPLGARAATGIPGLDDVLGGGFPRNRTYLVQGDPGTGKTTLALQFLLEGVAQGERGVYVTLSETRTELEDVARSHGWSLEGVELYELSAAQQLLQARAQQDVFEPAEVELSETTRALLEAVNRGNPTRVVLDSLSELRLLGGTSLRFRQQILAIKQYFAERRCTVLLLDDRTVQTDDRQLQSLAHGVLDLEIATPEFGAERRRLRVVKVRGMSYREGYHDYVIRAGGLRVFPRLVPAEHRDESAAEVVPSGVPELDDLVGGGPLRGTALLLVGPAGGGKSTLALRYATTAADRGERVAIYLFDERPTTYTMRAGALGMRLADHLAADRIQLRQVDPAELSPGEFVQAVRDAVERDDARMVVIDSLDGYFLSMPAERFLVLQLHDLLAFLGQKGVTTLLSLEQRGLLPGHQPTGVDLSYLSDTVLLLRYYEYGGEIRRALSCVKHRGGDHERTIRDLRFTPNGLVVGEPLTGFRGILTGVPVREEGAA